MVYLGNLDKASEGKFRVGLVHFMPFDKDSGLGRTEEELRQAGVLLDELAEPEVIDGKYHQLFCNIETQEAWYEYKDIEVQPQEESIEQKISRLEQENKIMSEVLDFLIMNTPMV